MGRHVPTAAPAFLDAVWLLLKRMPTVMRMPTAAPAFLDAVSLLLRQLPTAAPAFPHAVWLLLRRVQTAAPAFLDAVLLLRVQPNQRGNTYWQRRNLWLSGDLHALRLL